VLSEVLGIDGSFVPRGLADAQDVSFDRTGWSVPCARAHDPHFFDMKKRPVTTPFALPMMTARLTAASLGTIFHRTTMMANGTCSPAEYQRMVTEKTAAAQRSMVAMMTGKSPLAVLAPFSGRARANAKRLRRKGAIS
jgi:hypothetical protein